MIIGYLLNKSFIWLQGHLYKSSKNIFGLGGILIFFHFARDCTVFSLSESTFSKYF